MSWYCINPFGSISTDTQGYYEVCCESGPSGIHVNDMTISEYKNSDYLNEIKQAFKSKDARENELVKKACAFCIKKEKEGAISKRIRDNNNKNFEPYLELKMIGNICNYACVMCSPRSSSILAEEHNLDIPKYFDPPEKWWNDFKEIALEYKTFKFSGGEPFMSPTFKKIIRTLKEINHTDVRLQIHTNGSVSSKVLQKLIDSFSNVSILFSIDAWGHRNELIRKNSNWEETEERIWEYANLVYSNPTKIELSYSFCVSILNVGYLHEFDDFISTFGKTKISFSCTNTLTWPDSLNAYYLPTKIKQMYLKRLPTGFDNIKPVKAVLSSKYEGDLFKTHLQQLSLKIPTWREHWPEFLPYE